MVLKVAAKVGRLILSPGLAMTPDGAYTLENSGDASIQSFDFYSFCFI